MGGCALCMMDSHGSESDPLMIVGALDLMVWVCIQGVYCRCIFMPYCALDHRDMIVSIHVS